MNTIITYGTNYGSAKKYAEKLSELTGFSVKEFSSAKDLKNYDRIIHVGCIFAGMIKGLKYISENLNENAELVLLTVGIKDPELEENISSIKEALKIQVPEKILSKMKIYNLRGKVNLKELKFFHKIIMKMICKQTEKKDENLRTKEDKDLIEILYKEVDFIDLKKLDKIAKDL